MTITAQIKKITYELLWAKGECTLVDIEERALKQGISIPPKSTMIRSTVYQLAKKDPCIQRVARGKYRYVAKNESDEHTENSDISLNNNADINISLANDNAIKYLDKTEAEMISILEELEEFKWFQSSDVEVDKARRVGIRIKEFYDTIGKKISDLSL